MTTWVTRFGLRVLADAVFIAWTRGTLDEQRAALAIPTNPIERHHLFLALSQALYAVRAEQGVLDEMLQIAWMHVAELPGLLVELERHRRLMYEAAVSRAEQDRLLGRQVPDIPPYLPAGHPDIPTFRTAVRALCQVGRFDEAKGLMAAAASTGFMSQEALSVALQRIAERETRFRRKADNQGNG